MKLLFIEKRSVLPETLFPPLHFESKIPSEMNLKHGDFCVRTAWGRDVIISLEGNGKSFPCPFCGKGTTAKPGIWFGNRFTNCCDRMLDYSVLSAMKHVSFVKIVTKETLQKGIVHRFRATPVPGTGKHHGKNNWLPERHSKIGRLLRYEEDEQIIDEENEIRFKRKKGPLFSVLFDSDPVFRHKTGNWKDHGKQRRQYGNRPDFDFKRNFVSEVDSDM